MKILVDEVFLEKIINTFLLIESQCNITGKPREAMRIRINDIKYFIKRSHINENYNTD